MKRTFIAAALAVALPLVASAQQSEKQQPEVLISTLPAAELAKQIAEATATIEHKAEVARGGPVTAVVRTGCMTDTAGACKVNVDIVVYKPDGSVFHQVKSLDLPAGRGTVPLNIDANAGTGVYKVVVTIRDLAARRFSTVEQQFGVADSS